MIACAECSPDGGHVQVVHLMDIKGYVQGSQGYVLNEDVCEGDRLLRINGETTLLAFFDRDVIPWLHDDTTPRDSSRKRIGGLVLFALFSWVHARVVCLWAHARAGRFRYRGQWMLSRTCNGYCWCACAPRTNDKCLCDR